MEREFGSGKIRLVQGDITQESTDAIVNAAHPTLLGGGCGGGEKGEPDILGSCCRNCLRLAAEKGLQSIAFPSIGTGAYGYPVEEAAPVALSAVATFLRKGKKAPGLGRFVLSDRDTFRTHREALAL